MPRGDKLKYITTGEEERMAQIAKAYPISTEIKAANLADQNRTSMIVLDTVAELAEARNRVKSWAEHMAVCDSKLRNHVRFQVS